MEWNDFCENDLKWLAEHFLPLNYVTSELLERINYPKYRIPTDTRNPHDFWIQMGEEIINGIIKNFKIECLRKEAEQIMYRVEDGIQQGGNHSGVNSKTSYYPEIRLISHSFPFIKRWIWRFKSIVRLDPFQQDGSFLIWGKPGSGLTTLLKHLSYHLEDEQHKLIDVFKLADHRNFKELLEAYDKEPQTWLIDDSGHGSVIKALDDRLFDFVRKRLERRDRIIIVCTSGSPFMELRELAKYRLNPIQDSILSCFEAEVRARVFEGTHSWGRANLYIRNRIPELRGLPGMFCNLVSWYEGQNNYDMTRFRLLAKFFGESKKNNTLDRLTKFAGDPSALCDREKASLLRHGLLEKNGNQLEFCFPDMKLFFESRFNVQKGCLPKDTALWPFMGCHFLVKNAWADWVALLDKEGKGEQKIPVLTETLAEFGVLDCEEVKSLQGQVNDFLRSDQHDLKDHIRVARAYGWVCKQPEPWREGYWLPLDAKEEFRMAYFPVTNQTFRAFLEGGGYQTKRWWDDGCSPEEMEWCEPAYWWDSHWNHPQQPVVGVSWYEARAFCRWLNHTIKGKGEFGSKVDVQLAPCSRFRDLILTRFSLHESGANLAWAHKGTTPVNLYPHPESDDHPYDLIGNVWEWTGDADWPDGGTRTNTDDPRCIALGGSWATREVFAQHNSAGIPKRRFHKHIRAPFLGFRCYLTPEDFS